MFDNDNRATAAAPQPAALRDAASAVFGDGFWGRERVNPEAPRADAAKAVPARR